MAMFRDPVGLVALTATFSLIGYKVWTLWTRRGTRGRTPEDDERMRRLLGGLSCCEQITVMVEVADTNRRYRTKLEEAGLVIRREYTPKVPLYWVRGTVGELQALLEEPWVTRIFPPSIAVLTDRG